MRRRVPSVVATLATATSVLREYEMIADAPVEIAALRTRLLQFAGDQRRDLMVAIMFPADEGDVEPMLGLVVTPVADHAGWPGWTTRNPTSRSRLRLCPPPAMLRR